LSSYRDLAGMTGPAADVDPQTKAEVAAMIRDACINVELFYGDEFD
jgi:hypothetical protein